MFFKETNTHLAKLDGLEKKLTLFENMSRDMMRTLNDAVSKISEANQNVAKCLVSHDERLRENVEEHRKTYDKLHMLEETNRTAYRELYSKIEKVENKIEKNIESSNKIINEKLLENDKFKSRLIGIGLVITLSIGFFAGITPFVSRGIDFYIDVREGQLTQDDIQKDVNELQ